MWEALSSVAMSSCLNRLTCGPLQDNPHAFGVAPFCKGEFVGTLKQTGSRIGSPKRLQIATALLVHIP